MSQYIYLGDRHTDPEFKSKMCTAVRRADGKCIRARNGNMLVEFDGKKVVVMARLLRKKVKLSQPKTVHRIDNQY